MLFGSEAFEDLIGELQLTSMMQQAEESGVAGNIDPSLKHMSHKQRAREVGCACKLAAKLQPYVDSEVRFERKSCEHRLAHALYRLCMSELGRTQPHWHTLVGRSHLRRLRRR